MGVRHKTVREAFNYVSKNPAPARPPIEMPIWELVARHVFDTAYALGGNRSEQKATVTAQKILLDRLVGKRRTGTHPAVAQERKVTLMDFTKREVEE